MIRLVIFDFDGTLADTREIIVRTNHDLQRMMGYPLSDEASIVATIGLPLRECILKLHPDLPQEELPVWVDAYRKVFNNLKDRMVPKLYPHVMETLQTLAGRGVVMSIASSRGSTSLSGMLKDMGLSPYVSYVLGAEDVTLAKPHPEPVLKTLETLEVPAPEALVVGDMPVDILMGSRAGARTCGVTYGNSTRSELLEAGADYIIDSFSQLESLLG